MNRWWANSLAVPHSSSIPVRSWYPAASSTMWSRFFADSANDAPSGAMSQSWKHQNGTVSFDMNSNAAAIFCSAAAIGSNPPASQGRSRVPSPKMSNPFQLKLCQ